jgi:hypothetical protein
MIPSEERVLPYLLDPGSVLSASPQHAESASKLNRLACYFLPIFVFAGILFANLFRFQRGVFISILPSRVIRKRSSIAPLTFVRRIALFHTPEAPGVPGNGRNWILAAAAYIPCWFFWIACVVVLYEIVYSFVGGGVSVCHPFFIVYFRDLLTILF